MRSTAWRARAATAGSIVTCGLHGLQRAPDLWQRDALHVRAQIARPHELDVGVLDRDVVAHRALGHQHHPPRLLVGDIAAHGGGRAGEVGLGHDLGRALGMRQHDHARMLLAQLADLGRREALVHLAVPGPGDDLDPGLGGDVLRQVLVGQHDDAVHAERLDHLARVARRAADVRLRLHGRRGVDVGDDRNAGIALAQQPNVGGGDRGGERAAGFQVGDQHGLFRIEQLGGLGHEVHAGQHDHVGVGLRRLARQRQAVADDVGDAVEDLGRLVVVREDDGVAVALEVEDGVDVAGKARPFDRRDHDCARARRARPYGQPGRRSEQALTWHTSMLSLSLYYARFEHFWLRKNEASLPRRGQS